MHSLRTRHDAARSSRRHGCSMRFLSTLGRTARIPDNRTARPRQDGSFQNMRNLGQLEGLLMQGLANLKVDG